MRHRLGRHGALPNQHRTPHLDDALGARTPPQLLCNGQHGHTAAKGAAPHNMHEVSPSSLAWG